MSKKTTLNDLGNPLFIAKTADGLALKMTPEQRSTHLYIAGGTGRGKSVFMEHLIHQDIMNARKTQCGMLLLDPHGATYHRVLKWMAKYRHYVSNVPVVPIDLRQDDWVIAYNLLRRRGSATPDILAMNLVNALGYVWKLGDTMGMTTFRRFGSAIFQALYELGLTIDQAAEVIDLENKMLREAIIERITSKSAKQNLRDLNKFSKMEYQMNMQSTANRLQEFVRNTYLCRMFSQPKVSFDFTTAIEDGSIILVNLATGDDDAKVHEDDAYAFATCLLTDLWLAGKARDKSTDLKPFYVYIDEFQHYVTPTIAKSLDQARGFGLSLTLVNQYPTQVIDASPDFGQHLYKSIIRNMHSKVVFSMEDGQKDSPDLGSLTRWLFRQTFDPNKVKWEQIVDAVIGHELQYLPSYASQSGSAEAQSEAEGDVEGASDGASVSESGSSLPGILGVSPNDPSIWATVVSHAESRVHSRAAGRSTVTTESQTVSYAPMLVPLWGKQVTSVQFSPLEEQFNMAQGQIAALPKREAFVRLEGSLLQYRFRTPDVEPVAVDPERVRDFRNDKLFEHPFALSPAKAEAGLLAQQELLRTLTADMEPTTTKARRRTKPTPPPAEAEPKPEPATRKRRRAAGGTLKDDDAGEQ